ncbi:immunity protein Imm33 domain-containing protein [Pontibacter ruber]|nr:DUF2185 domain-containing protein [Pontibacter ruber]
MEKRLHPTKHIHQDRLMPHPLPVRARWQILKSMKIIYLTLIMALFGFGNTKAQSVKKFKEPLNTAVFTTKFVIEESKPITYVMHDSDDGAWQFFSDDEFEDFESIAKIVGLGEIIKMDKSILELADMPEGYYAYRESVNSKWVIQKQEE